MFCGCGNVSVNSATCMNGNNGMCSDNAVLNQTLLAAFRSTRTTDTSAIATIPHTQPGMYYATVVAYNNALTRSKFMCSNGVLVDNTPPVMENVRVQGVQIRPGLVTNANRTAVWYLSPEGYRYPVASNCTGSNSSLALLNPEVFPIFGANLTIPDTVPLTSFNVALGDITLTTGFPALRDKNARANFTYNVSSLANSNANAVCSMFGPARLSMGVTDTVALRWSGMDPESGIADYKVGITSYVCPTRTNCTGEAQVLSPTSTSRLNYFMENGVGALDDESQIYFEVTAINKAQLTSTIRFGPVLVDTLAPQFVTQTLSVAQVNRTFVNITWQPSSIREPFSGLCKIEVAVGATANKADVINWRPVSTIDAEACTTNTGLASVSSASELKGLKDGHTYFVSLRVTSHAGVTAYSQSVSFLFTVSLPSIGLVYDLDPADLSNPSDIDFLALQGTTRLRAGWSAFVHRVAGSVTYQVSVELDNGTVVQPFVSVGTQLSYTFTNLSSLLGVLKRYRMRVRATNLIGSVEATSDGVRIVQTGPSSGRVWPTSGCASARNLIPFGSFLGAGAGAGASGEEEDIDQFPAITNSTVEMAVDRNISTTGWSLYGDAQVVYSIYDSVTKNSDTSSGMTVQAIGREALSLKPLAILKTRVSLKVGQPYVLSFVAAQRFTTAKAVMHGLVSVHGFGDSVGATTDVPVVNELFQVQAHYQLTEDKWQEFVFTFIALTDEAVISLRWTEQTATGELVVDEVSLRQCNYQAKVLSADRISAEWDDLPDANDFINHYEWAILPTPSPDLSALTSASLANASLSTINSALMWFTSVGRNSTGSTRISGSAVQEQQRYVVAVRACFPAPAGCMWPMLSSAFDIEVSATAETGAIDGWFEHHGDFLRVWVNWEQFTQDGETLQVYQWTMALAPTGSQRFLPWYTVAKQDLFASAAAYAGSNSSVTWTADNVTVDAQVDIEALPLHEAVGSRYYILVTGFDAAGAATTRWCIAQQRLQHEQIVVEVASFDADELNNKMENNVFPNVDFTTDPTSISAVWPFPRIVRAGWSGLQQLVFEWSLSTEPEWMGCESDNTVDCGTTTDSFVSLSGLNLQHGERYYMCIRVIDGKSPGGGPAPPDMLQRMQEWTSCGNGITVDLVPPMAAPVKIGPPESEGALFTSSPSELSVAWGAFEDVEVQDPTVSSSSLSSSSQVFSSGVQHYSVAVGTIPGAEDLVPRTVVGDELYHVFGNLTLVSGKSYYATVWAVDHVGHETKAFSQNSVTVDLTPPIPGQVFDGADGLLTSQMSLDFVTVSWTDFEDDESGIQSYLWALGSAPELDDIMTWTSAGTDLTAYNTEPLRLRLGQTLYTSVRAINNAGLHTTAVSPGLVVDNTAPITGYVHDGTDCSRDIDYQQDSTSVSACWGAFSDPESGIEYYELGVGTRPGLDNIRQFLHNGLTTSGKVGNLNLKDGWRVYVTVRACNRADACSNVTSNGVVIDRSPPLSGVVLDGFGGIDLKYTPMDKLVTAHWVAFQDPQSGIVGYDYCVSTTRSASSCDVVARTHAYLFEEISVKLQSSLALGQEVFVIVWATNGAGASVSTASNGVIVDTTPPTVVTPAGFSMSQIGEISAQMPGLQPGYQPFQSAVRAVWDYNDDQSAINHYIWSVRVQHDYQGHQPVEPTNMGDGIQGVKGNVLLYSGDEYFLYLSACNGAGLCSNLGNSNPSLIVDATPPTPGVFAETMTYNPSTRAITIRWSGFIDTQSGISTYNIAINRYTESQAGSATEDARRVYERSFVLPVANQLNLTQRYTLSLTAVNRAGLAITIVNVVQPTADTDLEILHEACHTEQMCTVSLAYPQEISQPLITSCTITEPFCDNDAVQPVDVQSIGSALNQLNITVYDGE